MDGAKILARIREFVKEKSDKTYSPVDLNGLMEDSLEMTRAHWKDAAFLAGIEIEIKKEYYATGMVMGDATELREVLTNLLLNAVDAMPQGGELILQTREEGDYVLVTIKDTGMGMTEEVKSKLFVPFFTTKGEKGTGLGLSLSFGIITQHKGEITVESTPGYGSSLTIKLPRCSRVEDKESAVETSLDRAHILVVEDEKNIREVLDEILSSAGHTVIQAENGLEGVEFFKKNKIDLVITDLGMPGLSGWEVADKIKAINPDTPVILSTGWGVNSELQVPENENVDRMINKPFNMQQILTLIGELLTLKKRQDKEQKVQSQILSHI
jgi:CheY-like chemotaxis protein/anti-sigma regulatory factor (Ser/Thr protein kinase)